MEILEVKLVCNQEHKHNFQKLIIQTNTLSLPFHPTTKISICTYHLGDIFYSFQLNTLRNHESNSKDNLFEKKYCLNSVISVNESIKRILSSQADSLRL